jgi:hypothetical protein
MQLYSGRVITLAQSCTCQIHPIQPSSAVADSRRAEMIGSNGTNHLGVNLSFTKFLFVTPLREDDGTMAKLRAIGATVARGFFNDFEADGTREGVIQDSIQFLSTGCPAATFCRRPRFALQVSSKYRPRLQETEAEVRRRAADIAEITSLDGATRVPQYTSAEMHSYAYKNASPRASGRDQHTVIIIPMRKTEEWWQKSALERHAYFYPHTDAETGTQVKGHAMCAEAGISHIYRRLYYNPDGHARPGEFDFITYFECADAHLPVFEEICRGLRDATRNPEWRFVVEGPEWRGRRVLRW